MEALTPFLPDLLKLSPIVFMLSLILFTFWTYFKGKEKQNLDQIEKKDTLIVTLMTDHSAKQLAMQEKTIQSNNQIAASHVQLSSSIDRLSVAITQNHDEVMDELSDLKTNGKLRRLPAKTATPPIVTA